MKGLKDNWALLVLIAAVSLFMGQATGRGSYQYTGPATGFVEIVQHDTNNLASPVRGIICEAAGTITPEAVDGTSETITVVAGQTIPGHFRQVLDTGTSLTNDEMAGLK